MKRIRVIFYKAAWDKHWLDNAISLWTGLISAKNRQVGPYSHAEIHEANSNGDFSLEHYDYPNPYGITETYMVGTCWTSTMRGKDNGTVKRPASTVIENAGRWDYCGIELTDEQYQRMMSWMEIEVDINTGYSKRDLLKFFGLGFMADKTKNICSEFCNNAIQQAWGLDDDMVVSPRRLAWKLKKAGYDIKPLKGE